jgi:hypothetical protein
MVRTVKLLAVMACLFFMKSTAFADTVIYFSDNAKTMPNWGTTAENGTDVIGVPNFTGGTVVTNNGSLTKITIDYTGWASSMYPGDLFLDTNSDNIWDYVVSLYNGDNSVDTNYLHYAPISSSFQITPTGYSGTSTSTSAPVYSINLAENYPTPGTPSSIGYLITSMNDSSVYWGTAGIRNNEPFAVTGIGSTSLGNANVSFITSPTNSLVFDLSGLNIPVSGPLTFGLATNCANDVVFENVNTPTVPESGTMLLLGSGLIGLAGFGRKKLGKQIFG